MEELGRSRRAPGRCDAFTDPDPLDQRSPREDGDPVADERTSWKRGTPRMSNVVKAAVPAVKIGIDFVRKHWKAIGAAFTLISKFLADHPEIPARVRDQIDRMQKRIAEQVSKPDPEAQIRGVLDVVRDEARSAGDGFASDPWLRKSDSIERDLRLAKVQDRAARKKTLSRLRGESDQLVADLLLALARTRSTDGGSAES